MNVKLTRIAHLIRPVKTMSVSTLASVPFAEPELFVKWTSIHLFVFVQLVYREILWSLVLMLVVVVLTTVLPMRFAIMHRVAALPEKNVNLFVILEYVPKALNALPEITGKPVLVDQA